MKSILVVEDENPLAKVLQDKLVSFGYDVQIVFNGEDALKKIHDKNFDLILLDIILPKIDGLHVLGKLKEMKIDIPVFVLSNLGQKEDLKKAIDLGAVEYFVKSNVTLSDIADYIKNFLKK